MSQLVLNRRIENRACVFGEGRNGEGGGGFVLGTFRSVGSYSPHPLIIWLLSSSIMLLEVWKSEERDDAMIHRGAYIRSFSAGCRSRHLKCQQLSRVVLGELRWIFLNMLVDTSTNTLEEKTFGKEFIPRLAKFRLIFPDFTIEAELSCTPLPCSLFS